MDFQLLWKSIMETHYLRALFVFVIAYLVMQILLFVFEKILLQLTKKTKTNIDDLIVEKTKLPFAFLIMIIGARFAAQTLEFDKTINGIIQTVITTLLIVIVAHIISTILRIIIENWANNQKLKTKVKIDENILKMFHRVDRVIIYSIAVIYILKIWGIEIGPLVASLGVAGIAVAFALQTTLGNIFGGAAIIIDKAVRLGDIIEMEDGTTGEVVKVSLRSTKIKTFDNDLITIPNGKLADSRIKNWNLPDMKTRIKVKFSVAYGTDVKKVKKIVLDLMKNEKTIIKNPEPVVMFDEMGDFGLNFNAYFWISDVLQKAAFKDMMTSEIYNSLQNNKFEIPYPTRTIYIKKEK